MKKNKEKMINLKLMVSMLSLSGIMVATGFGCGLGFEPIAIDSVSNNSSFAVIGGTNELFNNGELDIKAGQKTVALHNVTSSLRNMETLAGVELLDQSAVNTYQQKINSFSKTGLTTTMNASYVLGVMTVGGAVCDQLVSEESAITDSTQRRIFNSFGDFGQNDNPSNAQITEVIQRQARNFWGREPASAETDLILAGAGEVLADQNQNNNDRKENLALYLCTLQISATDSYVN